MSNSDKCVIVCGGFDDIRSSDVRFLQEAARFGLLHVFLWNDKSLRSVNGKDPKFPENERLYFLQAIRFVNSVYLTTQPTNRDKLPFVQGMHPSMWTVQQTDDTPSKQVFCRTKELEYRVLA